MLAGPHVRAFRLEPRLKGTWSLRLEIHHPDGSAYEGPARVVAIPGSNYAGGIERGTCFYPTLGRNYEELYVQLPGLRHDIRGDRPAAGEVVDVSFTVPRPWTVTVDLGARYVGPQLRVTPAQVPEPKPWIVKIDTDTGWRVLDSRGGSWRFELLTFPATRTEPPYEEVVWERTLELTPGQLVTLRPRVPERTRGR